MLKRRIYALCALIGLAVGSVGAFPAANTVPAVYIGSVFTDVPVDSWFCPYVGYLSAHGVVKGVTATEYAPYGNVTVAEAAAVITRYLKLEPEAAKRKNAMELLGVNGSDKWFAGYIQLMHEAGIIDVTKYGCSVYGSSVSIDDPSLLQMPVKRYEFAAFIVRSFELDGTNIKTGDGTNGNEYIYGGYYDESKLLSFASSINDYASIPSDYSYYILKAYYNGIFNGDNLGNFNPLNNLTRAEMAKVVTVVIDQSQRTFSEPEAVQPNVPSGYTLGDDSYTEYKGVKYLKSQVTDSILTGEVVSCFNVFYDSSTEINITYTPSAYYPAGYTVKLRHYRKQPTGFYKELAVEYADNVYSSSFMMGDILLFVMTDIYTGEAVDAYEIMLNKYGLTENSHCNYLP